MQNYNTAVVATFAEFNNFSINLTTQFFMTPGPAIKVPFQSFQQKDFLGLPKQTTELP